MNTIIGREEPHTCVNQGKDLQSINTTSNDLRENRLIKKNDARMVCNERTTKERPESTYDRKGNNQDVEESNSKNGKTQKPPNKRPSGAQLQNK